jgi:hypothetical protein
MNDLHRKARSRSASIITPPLPPVTYHGGKVLWSPELLEWLRNAWALGLPGTEIANRMGHGITKNAVCGKKGRSPGFTNRPSPIVRLTTEDQEKEIKELILLGKMPKQISKMTGATTDQIYRVRVREKLPPVSKVITRKSEPTLPPILYGPLSAALTWTTPNRGEVVFLPVGSSGRCCWLDGESPKTFRQCEAMTASGEDVPRPWSYCRLHRSVAYISVGGRA